MKNSRRRIVVFLLYAITALPQAGVAQQSGPANQPQVYQVEIILFRYTNPSQTSTETLRAPASTTALLQETELTSSSQPPLNDSLQQSLNSQLQWLPADPASERLGNVSRRLAASGAYKVLAHRTWLQLTPDQGGAESLSLADLDIAPDAAVGRIKLYQKQFLYLAAEISMGGMDPVAAPAIAGSRKMPLGKVVYFDHPQFGLIATVTRSDLSWPSQ